MKKTPHTRTQTDSAEHAGGATPLHMNLLRDAAPQGGRLLLPEDCAEIFAAATHGCEYVQNASGLIVPARLFEAERERHRRLTAVDFFAGCGGASLGLIQAGYQVLAAVDNSCDAAVTYCTNLGTYPIQIYFVEESDGQRLDECLAKIACPPGRGNALGAFPSAGSGRLANHPEYPGVPNFILGDIRRVTGEQILNVIGLKRGDLDVVIGGPPCQGYSFAGKRDVLDPRNSYIFDFARLVCELDPKGMVMENVPGILSMMTADGVPVIAAFCRILADGGFAGYNSFLRAIKAQFPEALGMLREKQAPDSAPAQSELF